MSFIRLYIYIYSSMPEGNLVPSRNHGVNWKECHWAIAVKEELD